MIIPENQFADYYDRIKEVHSSTGSVLIFCAEDTDAICACHILVTLLEQDDIRYHIVPVNGYNQIVEEARHHFQSLEYGDYGKEDGPEPPPLVFLNCGGSADLVALLNDLNPPDAQLYFVADSHRPYHLSNVYDDTCVCVWHDGSPLENLPESYAAHRQAKLENDDSDSDSDSDDDYGDDDFDDDDDVSSDESAGEEVSDSPRSRKRRKIRRKKKLQKELRRYYRGTYFGTSIAGLFFRLSLDLGRETNHLLWLAIVGLTEHYVQDHITPDSYQAQANAFEEKVRELNPTPEGEMQVVGDRSASYDRISLDTEYRFTLYRHWSLYDAMYHSTYIHSRLGIWKPQGRHLFDEFLAKMGIPLDDARQRYSAMNVETRQKFRERIDRYAREFKLTDISYRSFHRSLGYRMQLSAADLAYAINALLMSYPIDDDDDADPSAMSAASTLRSPERGGGRATTATATSTADDSTSLAETSRSNAEAEQLVTMATEEAVARKRFWVAFDSLALSDAGRVSHAVGIIEKGLQLAVQLQQSVIALGTALLEKGSIRSSGQFRYAVLQDIPTSRATQHAVGRSSPSPAVPAPLLMENVFFQHPLSLLQVIQFLLLATKEEKAHGRHSSKPLVIAVLNRHKHTYLIVTSASGRTAAEGRRNTFASAFRSSIAHTGARVQFDGFESSIISVQGEHFERFMGYLHSGQAVIY